MNLHTVICIGSNVENKQLNVAEIVAQLATMFKHFRASDIYENADDSGLGNPYANAVCCGDYDGDFDSLAAFAAQREAMYGRTPQSKTSGVMPLDIDIVVFHDCIINRTQFDKDYFRQGYTQLSASTPLCPSMPK